MIGRRAFVRTGLALPAASIAAGLGLGSGTAAAASGTLELGRFVYDARFAEAFDVAQHVGALGIPLSPITDDLMALWYDELDLEWKTAPRALAGVTLGEALFVLETLALDRQMRVVYRGEHSPPEDGVVRHKLAGPKPLVERLAALPADAPWERELGRALAACPLGAEAGATSLATQAPALALRDETIYSWIIAPRSAAASTIPRS